MMVMKNRYGKWIMLQVESTFPTAHFGLEVYSEPSHYCITIPYEIDIELP